MLCPPSTLNYCYGLPASIFSHCQQSSQPDPGKVRSHYVSAQNPPVSLHSEKSQNPYNSFVSSIPAWYCFVCLSTPRLAPPRLCHAHLFMLPPHSSFATSLITDHSLSTFRSLFNYPSLWPSLAILFRIAVLSQQNQSWLFSQSQHLPPSTLLICLIHSDTFYFAKGKPQCGQGSLFYSLRIPSNYNSWHRESN